MTNISPKTNVKLKRTRLQLLLTIEQAAEKVGVTHQTYSRWEKGLQKPHLTTLKLLCKAFEKKPEELGFEDLCF